MSFVTYAYEALTIPEDASKPETAGRKIIMWTIAAISWAAQLYVMWNLSWYMGLLISLLMAAITLVIHHEVNTRVSPETFEKVGNRIGRVLGRFL